MGNSDLAVNLMANESGPVKVVFIERRADPLDQGHNHVNAHYELVHFHPMLTPANYVTRGEQADLDPSENKNSWFNLLNSKITDLAQVTTNSSAMNLSNAIRSPKRKEKHYWTNWVKFVTEDE